MFVNDPDQKVRHSDATLAWSWREYIDDPDHDPMWIANLPMVKAAVQCIRATQEFLEQKDIIKTNGWIISGASKRGWAALLLGVANQTMSRVTVLGLAPLVPIVPDLRSEIHRQWRSYNAYTWAFKDYMEAGLTHLFDTPECEEILRIVDPIYSLDRLENIPMFIMLSSDDEFMMFDWTNIYYDRIPGEKHILIVANSEHSMATALISSISNIGTFIRSIAAGITSRPSFIHNYDEVTGQLSVTLPSSQVAPLSVKLFSGQTFSTERRDFRWIV